MCVFSRKYLLNNVLILNKYLHEKRPFKYMICINHLKMKLWVLVQLRGMRRRFSLCIPVSLCWVSNES